MNILLVEDEPDVASFIKKILEKQQYLVTVAANGNIGLKLALNVNFDLIILDVLLPDINGLEVCRSIRDKKRNTPILILTALGTVQDKVNGLESGADDYLTKPFHLDEFLARINALKRRRNNAPTNKTYQVADLVLNCNKRTVARNNKEIVLSVKEFTLLEVLMANKNKILSRSFIANAVWGGNFDKGSNLIDVYINFLRNKIDKDANTKLIQTVIGMGYVIRD